HGAVSDRDCVAGQGGQVDREDKVRGVAVPLETRHIADGNGRTGLVVVNYRARPLSAGDPQVGAADIEEEAAIGLRYVVSKGLDENLSADLASGNDQSARGRSIILVPLGSTIAGRVI